jgi:hypothetical protein
MSSISSNGSVPFPLLALLPSDFGPASVSAGALLLCDAQGEPAQLPRSSAGFDSKAAAGRGDGQKNGKGEAAGASACDEGAGVGAGGGGGGGGGGPKVCR